ncbi:MAG: PAS domain S-box protein [Thermodesulfovibrionales bacterium]|nr:PAS domain S-box protein [Thermodesulfovibrionales bacterium]
MKEESELILDNAMYKIMQDSLNSLPIGVTITDIEGKIIYTNNAEASMHGYTVEELIGNDARIMAPPHLWKYLDFEKLHKMGDWKRKTINIKKKWRAIPCPVNFYRDKER